MSSLFGAHLLTPLDQGAVQSAERAQVAAYKTMASDVAPIADFLNRKTDGLVIVRHYFELSEQAEYRRMGAAGASVVVNRIMANFGGIIDLCAARGVPVYAEGLNEPDPNPWSELPALSDWYVAFADECHAMRLRPLAYSWGTGNPPTYGWGPDQQFKTYMNSLIAQWKTLYHGLKACHEAGGGGAWHAYDWPGWLTDPYWQGLRYLNDLDAIAAIDPGLAAGLGVYVTEASIDVGIKPEYVMAFGERKGWRTALKGDGAEFARQAGAYEQAVRRSKWAKNIKVITPFTGGTGGGWADYSTDNVPEYEALVRDQQKEGTMPTKPTTITPQNRPYGEPGGTAVFEFKATGVDGTAKGFADVSYPPLPGNEFGSTYGDNMTTELPPFKNGTSTVTVNLPPNDHPLPAGGVQAELRLRILELDGKEFDGGIHGPFALDIVQGVSQPQPAPQPPVGTVPPTPPANPGSNWQNSPNLGLMTRFYEAAHALEGNADPKVSEIGRRAVGYLDNWKDGSDLPFEGKPKK